MAMRTRQGSADPRMAAPKESQSPPANFEEAYCRRYRVRPARFVASAFWRTLYRHGIPLTVLTGGFDREFFQRDVETLVSIGAGSTQDDLDRAIDEHRSLADLERSIIRGTLKCRVSDERLWNVFQPLTAGIRPVEKVEDAAPVRTRPLAGETSEVRAPGVTVDGLEARGVMLRKLSRVHESVVRGGDPARLLAGEGLEGEALEEALERCAGLRPEIAWLRKHLGEAREMEQLREENRRLARLVKDLSLQVAAGNGPAAPPRGGG